MTAAYLTLFTALTACQVLLTVKVADWLSADGNTGRGAAETVPAHAVAGLA